jgi:replicative superfamily II helicase
MKNAFVTDIMIAKSGGKQPLIDVAQYAKVLLAKNILYRIADTSAKLPPTRIAEDDYVQLEEALALIELRCFDLADVWRRDARSEHGIEFRDFCSLAFDIRRILSFGNTADEYIKNTLRLAVVGILGDRNADIRRFLNENTQIWQFLEEPQTDWPRIVLFNIATAFLRIIRKNNWADLDAVAETIAFLRIKQKEFEDSYLQQENGIRQVAALELVAFYQLAKATELLAIFVGQGTPPTIIDDADFHFSRAIKAADSAGLVELAILSRWLGMASISLVRTTIWHQLTAYNSKISEFKKVLAGKEQNRPMFELLPPQREAVQEVMNTGNRAVVVEMPTSSGKTLLAEFRIVQTKVNIPNAWIAYLVPTNALVNQITIRLRRDLGALGIQVEQAIPAYELNGLEEELLSASDCFDVIVTTPEKLDLLIRNDAISMGGRPLGLVVLDEAHNLGDGERGLRSELVLSTINRESPETHFLLLTPFVPNASEIALWLDSERSKSITPSLSINWQPNDRLIAIAYLKGRGKSWGLELKPLHVSQPHRSPISFAERITLQHEKPRNETVSKAKLSKISVAALTAEALSHRGTTVVLAYSPNDCWNLAEKLADRLPQKTSDNLSLVLDYIEAECGADFALCKLLEKGIAVHHAGLPPEIRTLLEWLVEEGELITLVATSTLAQGVNFPISNVILSTNSKSMKIGDGFTRVDLQHEEFWNIAGRAGRLFQETLGLVLFASQKQDDDKIETFVNKQVGELASALEQMLEDTIERGRELDLHRLVRNDKKWSSFVQYLSHCYRKINDHKKFLADTEKLLKRTYAYHRLSQHQPELAEQLIESTRIYAEQLQKLQPGVLTLVDNTGFSPESIVELLNNKSDFAIKPDEWSPSRLFQGNGEGMKKLVGALLNVNELDFDVRIGKKEGKSIAEMLDSWVSGKTLREIADMHFSDEEDVSKRITECCRMVYQTLTHQGSWGFGALQAMSGFEKSELSPQDKEEARFIPSMIYYGVSTVEAVLMRSLGVPRSVSVELGNRFAAENNAENNNEIESRPRIQVAREWLEKSSTSLWIESAKTAKITVSGERIYAAWRIITGKPEGKA